MAQLTIEQETVPLFYSVDWIVRAKVNDQIIVESGVFRSVLTKAAVRQWARAFIRKYYEKLLDLGVDVEKCYIEWGGSLRDL